ncbi:hypothetical protein BpHYR1_001905 [Brachionus plicatilis]|uniref:Uncharacterized protein n=1 Tax=Brachionus plicatilis TaxID=10195 RepID=A0A3M7SJC7_BRAPC|nr:hypothetical protein BpHYR1_001905 [Brachionus plicatilis]
MGMPMQLVDQIKTILDKYTVQPLLNYLISGKHSTGLSTLTKNFDEDLEQYVLAFDICKRNNLTGVKEHPDSLNKIKSFDDLR